MTLKIEQEVVEYSTSLLYFDIFTDADKCASAKGSNLVVGDKRDTANFSTSKNKHVLTVLF